MVAQHPLEPVVLDLKKQRIRPAGATETGAAAGVSVIATAFPSHHHLKTVVHDDFEE